MKKKTIALLLIPMFAIADDFVTIVSGLDNTYIKDSFTQEIEISDWTNVGSKTCVSDVLESDIYYGESATQNNDCDQSQSRTITTTTTYKSGKVEVENKNESRVVNTSETVSIVGTHLESTCKNILDNGFSKGDSDYHIIHGDNNINVYCEMSRDNGGWMLVRRINNTWYNFTDNLSGAEVLGSYESNPLSSLTFGMKFNDFSFNDFLFTTGDKQKWLITNKSSVYDGWTATVSCGDSTGQVLKSSSNPNGETQIVNWCKRVGQSEDPWISIESHGHNGNSGAVDSFEHSMLYGEKNASEYYDGWDYYLNNLNGVSVYIR